MFFFSALDLRSTTFQNIMDARHGSFPEGKNSIHSDSPTARALRDIAFGSVSFIIDLELKKAKKKIILAVRRNGIRSVRVPL